ncbi:hypothetical protein DFH29DRAFT_1006785 [Suillus ampliporus]|nr:hypothetical protein DFH29DRAFT_1006785 [Suillus ampliporus]
MTASFFECGENQTAPTQSLVSDGPVTGLSVSKFHIRAVKSSDPLRSSLLSAGIAMQAMLPGSSSIRDVTTPILDRLPEEVVDIAIQALKNGGLQLVEWGTLLYRRMKIPGILRNFQTGPANETQGDMHAKGRFYRITRVTRLPASFTSSYILPLPHISFLLNSLRSVLPICRFLNAQTYWNQDPQLDLGELIYYFFLGYTIGVLALPTEEEPGWEREDENRRIDAASQLVKQWGLDGEWRQDQEWIGDTMEAMVTGDKSTKLELEA